MAELPSGTVTFLFTDLEGSTRLWEEHPDEMREALARHDEILRNAIAAHDGAIVKTTGDGVHAAFTMADDAVAAAIDAQLRLGAEEWGETDALRVRMGIHTGPAELRDGDYYSSAVNRAARLMGIAHGGQVVVSHATEQLVRDTLPADVSFIDLGEHRLRDLGSTERVYQVMHGDLAFEFPELRSLDAYPGNLPTAITSFVGRDEALREIAKVLLEARVVTLTGVGGVGKTRLAVQVAAEVLPRYPDGAWLVELAAITDSQAVPELVAATLGIPQRQGQNVTDSILFWVRNRCALLVLDNCEHVLDSAARLANAIVRASPEVTVLATSREGLGLMGERMLAVRSLDVPSDDSPVETLAAIEAVRLFVERAGAVRSGFALTSENADAVVQVCRRLDGIPLAIELAAARVRMMSPGEISARLDERFRLLTGGARTAVERHQTLRRTVDWSYDLLTEPERSLLNRLSVFSSGFTLDAAESVASDEGLDVLEGLGQLVDKSLVVADAEADGSTRYRLLETIRQYALEALEDSGETDAIRRRHGEWCASLAQDIANGLRGSDEIIWHARLSRELDNLRVGVTWATGMDDAAAALAIIGPFPSTALWGSRSGYALAPWAALALTTSDPGTQPTYASVLALRAMDHLNKERLAEARADADAATAAARTPTDHANALHAVIFIAAVAGRATEVSQRRDEYLATIRATADPYLIASGLSMVASIMLADGAPADGLEYAEEAFELAKQVGNPSLFALACYTLAGAVSTDDAELAWHLLDDGLAATPAAEYGFRAGMILGRMARIRPDTNDQSWAQRFRQGLLLAYDGGDIRQCYILLDIYAQCLAAAGRAEPAAVVYGTLDTHADHLANKFSADLRVTTATALVETLGADQFAELRAKGTAMDIHQAVSFALTELDRSISHA
jgi:predicted ATPase/class 3 adenylate cyclase